jgi:hypothetical protein
MMDFLTEISQFVGFLVCDFPLMLRKKAQPVIPGIVQRGIWHELWVCEG